MDKRGELSNISGFILTMGTLAIVLVVVFVILANLGTNASVLTTGSKVDSNSVTTVNSTAIYFADYDSRGNTGISCSNVNLYNGSNAQNVTRYFTLSGCYATLTNNSFTAQAKQVNYSMSFYEYSYGANATETTQSSLFGLVGWLPIVVIAFIGGIVLMLIIKQFSK